MVAVQEGGAQDPRYRAHLLMTTPHTLRRAKRSSQVPRLRSTDSGVQQCWEAATCVLPGIRTNELLIAERGVSVYRSVIETYC